MERVDEECDGVEGCRECDYCVRSVLQLHEHVAGYLEVFQAYIQIEYHSILELKKIPTLSTKCNFNLQSRTADLF